MIKGIETRDWPDAGAIDTHGVNKWLSAMVPTAQSHAMSVEVATYLLSGESRYHEGHNTATVLQISRSKDPCPRDGHKAVEQAARQSQFVQLNGGPIKRLHPVERSAKANGSGAAPRCESRTGGARMLTRRDANAGILATGAMAMVPAVSTARAPGRHCETSSRRPTRELIGDIFIGTQHLASKCKSPAHRY